MVPYYLFFMFFGLSACLDYLRPDDDAVKKLKNVVFVLGFFFILFFVGFRYKIGSDWLVYIQLYEHGTPFLDLLQGHNLAFTEDFTEPGYKLFAALCHDIGLDFGMFVFLITLFNTISLFTFLHKNGFRNKLVFLAIIMILTAIIEFDILRQSIAFHVVLFAFVGDRIKPFRFYALVALAMMFHYTAVIYIVFYFFQKWNLTKKGLIFTTVLYFVSLFVTLPLITSFLQLIQPFAGGVLGAVIAKGQSLIKGFEFSRNISFTSLLNLMFLVLLSMNIEKLKLAFTESILLKMFIFYILLNVGLKEVQEVADRFSYYFTFGIAFMFAMLTGLIRIREKKMLLMLTPAIFIMMRLQLHFKRESIRIGQTPYRNYFFIDETDEKLIKMRYDLMQSKKLMEDEGKKN
ncbi:EpsG-like putative glucosyltransferase [Chitinophaga sp. S165]|nr:EpsG-like putative glucosyltransferase [Chitinophaga sp. S165]